MTSSTQRTVVITGVGAERGIGRATAHRFARDGWAVAGLDLDGDAAAKLAAELTEQYGVPGLRRRRQRRRRGLRAGRPGRRARRRTCPPSARC